MSYRQKLLLFQSIVFFAGFGLLIWADWRVAVGVLFTHWANNVRIELEADKL